MTAEEKTTSKCKQETCCSFPFESADRVGEMMRNCCPSETKDFDCGSMMRMMMGKERCKADQE